MSKSSEAVKRWRKITKKRLVSAFGGKCTCCGYFKCDNALEFHHTDPDQKDFSFGKVRENATSWEKIVKEIKKCTLVCSNCHKEIHCGITILPENYARFNEDYSYYKDLRKYEQSDPCPICGKPKPIYSLTCSRHCSIKRIIPKSFDNNILDNLCKTMSVSEIAEHLNMSYRNTKIKLDKLNLIAVKKFVLKSSYLKNRVVERPPYFELKEEIKNLGYSKTGRKYGVSDNAIRKWIRFYEKCEKFKTVNNIIGA